MFEEWLDVTVTHPARESIAREASNNDGAAVEEVEKRKLKRYGVGLGGVSCTPFGLETWGRMGASANSFLDRLAGQHAALTGQPRTRLLKRWRAVLGVVLCRALAESVRQAARRPAAAEHEVED